MSTICKVAIKANETDVLASISEFLGKEDDEYEQITSEWAMVHDSKDFNIDEYLPTLFSIKQVLEDITEIHYNSFSKVVELVSHITKELNTKAIVNIYQSTAEACYWAYYLNGELLREIESGDGEISINEGLKFPFENDILGHNISESGEEPFYVFDSGDMESYNNKVGIKVEIYQEYDENWVNFQRKSIVDNTKPKELATNKPWWKFW